MPQFFAFNTALVKSPGQLGWYGYAEGENNDMPRAELINNITNLGKENESLELAGNQFGLTDIDFLMQILATINKSNISKLDLSFNQLYKMELDNLLTFLSQIPSSVQELNLSNNQFYDFTDQQLLSVINAIPLTVKTVDLSYCLPKDSTQRNNILNVVSQARPELNIVDESSHPLDVDKNPENDNPANLRL